jgi:DNA-binding NtrC family response regulator
MNEVSKKSRILILNDDLKILGMARESVERAGYEVIATTDETEAEKCLRAGGVDAFVQDLRRGDSARGGWELFRILHEDETLKRIPKICMSAAEPTMKLAQSLAQLGVDGSVCLPTSFDELVVEIEKALAPAALESPLAGVLPDFPPYKDYKDVFEYFQSEACRNNAKLMQNFLHRARYFGSVGNPSVSR